ncbi:hypothetical protein CPC08DRAFT_775423 [Agrocybe pediades]|nr:hypothetical protein CPC08DRAFT_775423 [Agrocybe pediades]
MASSFDLPGPQSSESKIRLQLLIAALSLAYSGRSNPRRLEDPFYTFWGLWFDYLVHDLAPEVLTCAQFRLYPGYELGNADTSLISVKGPNGSEVIPDFVHLVVTLSDRHNLDSPPKTWPKITNWDVLKVSHFGLVTIGEIKRPPSRHFLRVGDFESELVLNMNEAQTQAFDQALMAFIDSRFALKEVVLVAAAGEWWTFRFLQREEVDDQLQELEEFESESEYESDDGSEFQLDFEGRTDGPEETARESKTEERKRVKAEKMAEKMAERKRKEEERQREEMEKREEKRRKAASKPRSKKVMHYRSLQGEGLMESAPLTIPTPGNWSRLLRIGSATSNQAQLLVHSKINNLKKAITQSDDLEFDTTMLGTPVVDPNSVDESDTAVVEYEDEDSSDDELRLKSPTKKRKRIA